MSRDGRLSTDERALEIASSGLAHSMSEVRDQLSSEGYENVFSHMAGASMRMQIMSRIDKA